MIQPKDHPNRKTHNFLWISEIIIQIFGIHSQYQFSMQICSMLSPDGHWSQPDTAIGQKNAFYLKCVFEFSQYQVGYAFQDNFISLLCRDCIVLLSTTWESKLPEKNPSHRIGSTVDSILTPFDWFIIWRQYCPAILANVELPEQTLLLSCNDYICLTQ